MNKLESNQSSQNLPAANLELDDDTNDLDYPDFDLKAFYVGGYELAKRRWTKLTLEEYKMWHAFITFIIQSGKVWWYAFEAKMIEPIDFARLVRQRNFVREKCKPVLELMFATGIDSNTKLYFRLDDFITYAEQRYNWPRTNRISSKPKTTNRRMQ